MPQPSPYSPVRIQGQRLFVAMWAFIGLFIAANSTPVAEFGLTRHLGITQLMVGGVLAGIACGLFVACSDTLQGKDAPYFKSVLSGLGLCVVTMLLYLLAGLLGLYGGLGKGLLLIEARELHHTLAESKRAHRDNAFIQKALEHPSTSSLKQVSLRAEEMVVGEIYRSDMALIALAGGAHLPAYKDAQDRGWLSTHEREQVRSWLMAHPARLKQMSTVEQAAWAKLVGNVGFQETQR